jgi:hypothetical protein
MITIIGWLASSAKKRVSPKQLAGPDALGNMFVRDCTDVEVRNIREALAVLAKGHTNRQVFFFICFSDVVRAVSLFLLHLYDQPVQNSERMLFFSHL